MSDVDRDVRTLLDAKAEEMRLEPTIPDGLIRRARRRRVINATLTGVVTVAVAVGSFAGIRTLLQETEGPERGAVPAGTEIEPYALIYPETQEQLDNIRNEVEQGSMPLWQSPRGVAELFAVNVLGWDPGDVEVEDAVEEFQTGDSSTAVVSNPSLSGEAGIEEPIRTTLTLIRLPYPELEMYAVLGTIAESMSFEPRAEEPILGQESLTFQGNLDFVVDGLTVELSFDGGDPVSAPVTDGRFEIEGPIPGGLQPLTIITIAVKDGSGRTLALTSAPSSTSLGAGPAIDSAETSSFGPATPRVLETLRDIYEAASAGDWDALRALIPENGFTFSFGLADDPIAYWQDLEAQGEPVLDTLATLVQTEPAQSRGTFIFPAPAAEAPQEWDQEDLDVLREIHTEREIRQFQDADLYFGWRVGIERNGTWVFFVAGD